MGFLELSFFFYLLQYLFRRLFTLALKTHSGECIFVSFYLFVFIVVLRVHVYVYLLHYYISGQTFVQYKGVITFVVNYHISGFYS